MSIIDFPIERINEFLSDHSFVVTKPLGENIEVDGYLTVKIKLTGIKPMISVGEWNNFIEYTLILEEVNDNHLKSILGYMFASVKTHDYVISNTDTKFYLLTTQVNQLLRSFLTYFGINNYVTCTRIIDKVTNIDPKYMTESIINEGKYSNVIRHVVKDILKVFKHQKEGEYQLPEDISTDEEDMVYDFPQLGSSFTVNLILSLNDEIDTVDVDGEYYEDDDSIDIRIESNPNLDRETLEELHFELNELVAHELQHLIQRDDGYVFPKKETKKSLKYYTQPHEIDAQITGFKRRAQKERKPYEDVVRSWFKRNQLKHQLTQDEMGVVINKLLGGK
jgi:hypothetical protein